MNRGPHVSAASVSASLQRVAKAVDDLLFAITGEHLGFMLLIWAGGEVNYVGTERDRARVIRAMRELIAKWEAGVDETPANLRN